MARAIYSHELIDPDFAWLVSSFLEDHPQYTLIDSVGLPLVFIERPIIDEMVVLPMLPEPETDLDEDVSLKE